LKKKACLLNASPKSKYILNEGKQPFISLKGIGRLFFFHKDAYLTNLSEREGVYILMDNRRVLIGLHELEGIGWKTILHLISRLPDLTSLLELSPEQLSAFQIKPQQAHQIITHLHASYVDQKLRDYENNGVRILTLYDEGYPQRLKETATPPWVLYCKGDISLLNKPLLGMVGTRTPTVYGKRVAVDLASTLSKAGFGIASGLARGIDSCVHQGAIQGKGSTIAVLGCPVGHIYPPENKYLYGQIEHSGLIISEYPKGTGIMPGMFPMRNRIIAGISLGVVVVEGGDGSGSFITVQHAVNENRDVFAVPGPITSPKSLGVLKLIKEGSKMVTCAEDIIEDYRHLMPQLSKAEIHQKGMLVELSGEERKIIQILSEGTLSIDDLLEQSEFTFGHLHSVLLSLLMKKQIIQLPGSAYMIV
jgi:DNA processing protein